MAENSPTTFVRARPRKVSVTETYYYKVEVQDFINFQFDKADGEIKLEFLYDGAAQDFRWKLRQLLSTLLDRIKFLKQIKAIIQHFLHLRVIKWLVKWSGLLFLWRTLIGTILGREQDEKYFGVDAIADAAKGGSGCHTARVGRLVLYDERQVDLTKNWPTYETFAIELPIDSLQEKLKQNQRCILTYTYKPPQPTPAPLYLHKIELTDMELNSSMQLHSIYDELLSLTIPFEISVSAPSVDEKGKVTSNTIKLWWQEIQAQIVANNKIDGKKVNEEPQVLSQVWYIDTLDKLDDVVQRLALSRGGYILVERDQIKADDDKAIDDKAQRLKICLLKTAFQQNKVFIPVFVPYSYSIDNKEIFAIPIPAVPPRWYENRPDLHNDKVNNRLWVRSNALKIPVTARWINGETVSTVRDLAEIITGLANMRGGCFWVKCVRNSKQSPNNIVRDRINQARMYCVPPLDWKLIKIFDNAEDDQVFTIEIVQPSKEVHSVGGVICKWEDDQLKKLTPDKDTDEIYKLIWNHCRPSYPVIETLPVIEYAHLKGPQFDAREQNGAYYDPRQKTLKWTEKLPFDYNIEEQVYQKMLQVGFNRPVELYEQNELSGEVRISWPSKVLSGLGTIYFDALGVEIAREKLNIEKKSNIKIIFDSIVLLDVFQRRGFSALRELHFEGVKLEQSRLQDVQSMLADLGLENIRSTSNSTNAYFSQGDSIDEAYIEAERPDGLSIKLKIRGELTNLHRERKEGERTERMRVKSGSMHIIIHGFVVGDLLQAQELSKLLNHLQRLLKERFNYVRVQVV